ncbi:MAG: hypothetical protein ACWGQW_11940 [bacterium]
MMNRKKIPGEKIGKYTENLINSDEIQRVAEAIEKAMSDPNTSIALTLEAEIDKRNWVEAVMTKAGRTARRIVSTWSEYMAGLSFSEWDALMEVAVKEIEREYPQREDEPQT